MCEAENLYFVTCGCWSGQAVLYQCVKGDLAGSINCPDLCASGVQRHPGLCLCCRRRAAQREEMNTYMPLTIADSEASHEMPGAAYLAGLIRRVKAERAALRQVQCDHQLVDRYRGSWSNYSPPSAVRSRKAGMFADQARHVDKMPLSFTD
ncbi:hypothetical protein VDGL01_06807 [Verticillium dahliae]